MKNLFFKSITALVLIIMFGCETQEMQETTLNKENLDFKTIIQDEQSRNDFFNFLQNRRNSTQNSNGAQARSNGAQQIEVLIMNDGFAVYLFEENGTIDKVAFFDVVLGTKDKWTQLPDGSINIHVNSKTATATYLDLGEPFEVFPGFFIFPIEEELCGGNARLTINYNGTYVEETITNPWGTFDVQYIDMSTATSAATFHGQADVGPALFNFETFEMECGSPTARLSVHLVSNPRSGQENSFLKLD